MVGAITLTVAGIAWQTMVMYTRWSMATTWRRLASLMRRLLLSLRRRRGWGGVRKETAISLGGLSLFMHLDHFSHQFGLPLKILVRCFQFQDLGTDSI